MRNMNANRRLLLIVYLLGGIATRAVGLPEGKTHNPAQRWRVLHQVMVDREAWKWNQSSWDQEKIVTFGDFQYTVYWDEDRVFVLARRDLRDNMVQTLRLPSFRLTSDDRHRNTCLGVSPVDGRIHLSWDHHNNQLHYAKSQAGFLTEPPLELIAVNIEPASPMLSQPKIIIKAGNPKGVLSRAADKIIKQTQDFSKTFKRAR